MVHVLIKGFVRFSIVVIRAYEFHERGSLYQELLLVTPASRLNLLGPSLSRSLPIRILLYFQLPRHISSHVPPTSLLYTPLT